MTPRILGVWTFKFVYSNKPSVSDRLRPETLVTFKSRRIHSTSLVSRTTGRRLLPQEVRRSGPDVSSGLWVVRTGTCRSTCTHVCVCICVRVYRNTCVCQSTCVGVYVHVYTCTYMYVFTHTCVGVRVCTYVYVFVHVRVYMGVSEYVLVCVRGSVGVGKHVCDGQGTRGRSVGTL